MILFIFLFVFILFLTPFLVHLKLSIGKFKRSLIPSLIKAGAIAFGVGMITPLIAEVLLDYSLFYHPNDGKPHCLTGIGSIIFIGYFANFILTPIVTSIMISFAYFNK